MAQQPPRPQTPAGSAPRTSEPEVMTEEQEKEYWTRLKELKGRFQSFASS
jgi:hypothetical protein